MFKRFFSIYTLSILSITLLSGADLQYNLFKNASFELGADNWDSVGSGISISRDSFKGKKAIQYTTGGTGQTTEEIPVADGRVKYILNGNYKNIGQVDGMWLGISMLDKNWHSIAESSTSLQPSNTYKKFELKTTPPVGTQYMSFWTWSEAGANGKTLLDNLRLKPSGYEITKCNILQNSDFETDTNSWSTYSAETKLTNDAHTGTSALQLKDGGMDQISQEVIGHVDTYRFKGFYKTVGTTGGTWAGMNFYDKNYNLQFSKSFTLKDTHGYKSFAISATSNEKTYYIQAWVWSEAGNGGGKIILDELKISTSGCYNHVLPSSLPPGGIAVNQAPQFVVIGFDDNTKSTGIDWALNLFDNKRNADGSEARVSFYMNTAGLNEWIEDDPDDLLSAMKRLKNSTHEVANHTKDHHAGVNHDNIREFTQDRWKSALEDASYDLIDRVGVSQHAITGFRAPFLIYNQHLLNELKDEGFLYDCSIEEGYAKEFDGTNFRWPYQLDEGSPGHNESWYGNIENPKHVEIGPVDGLWELPNHVLMVPKDDECAKYGIRSGFWNRILTKIPYLSDFKITGFDYNLWSLVGLNKAEVLGLFKYNLDLRLKGNRAPFMIGAHTQYYVGDWAARNAPNATSTQMREAISEFIDYALTKPEVRIRPANEIINWCIDPTPIN